MLAGLYACLFMGKAIAFPATPIDVEVSRGAEVFARDKGIERTLMDDRQVLGKWFDGRVKRDVEWAIWLSPALVSRWLGYLQAKEKWPEVEIQSRWDAAFERLDGKLTFIVQLAACPKLGGLDMEPEAEADPAEIQQVRFLFTSGPGLPEAHQKSCVPWDQNKTIAQYHPTDTPPDGLPGQSSPAVERLAAWQMRERSAMERFRWSMAVPWGQPFRGEFEKPLDAPPFPIGEYYAAWFLVSIDVDAVKIDPQGFDLRIFSPQKERIAHFRLMRL